MVMGARPEVPTAGPLATVRALVGMLVAIVRGVLQVLARRPWAGDGSRVRSASHGALLGAMKGFMTYAAALPTPQLRSVEVVIDELSGLAMPPPWRRAELRIVAGAAGGMPGEWILPRHGPLAGVILYLHGGGYVATTPRMYRGIVSHLARQTRCAVFLPDYRMAPEFPFPAALDDARAAYLDLLDLVGPERLVVAGDSGGGGLTATLLEDLPRSGLPQPAGAVLLSPEIDLALSGRSIRANAPLDILPDEIPVDPYLQGIDPHDPQVSPLYADLHGYPPLLVTAGGDEMFRDEIRAFVARAEEAGVHVTFYEAPHMEHVFEILSPRAPSSLVAFEDVRDFVAGVLG